MQPSIHPSRHALKDSLKDVKHEIIDVHEEIARVISTFKMSNLIHSPETAANLALSIYDRLTCVQGHIDTAIRITSNHPSHDKLKEMLRDLEQQITDVRAEACAITWIV